MKSIIDGSDGVHLLGESAMHPPAPRSGRHAALLLLAGMSPPRRPPCRAQACRRQAFFALSN
ncbi:MAG: hypothetical protein WA129_07185, partial [Acidovorax sp.]